MKDSVNIRLCIPGLPPLSFHVGMVLTGLDTNPGGYDICSEGQRRVLGGAEPQACTKGAL